MEKLIKKNWRRYAVSSLVSFLAGFAMAVVPTLNALNLESLTTSAIWGIVFVGLRGGVKVLMEAFLSWYGVSKK